LFKRHHDQAKWRVSHIRHQQLMGAPNHCA
jgi:hypothetical protein